MARPRGQSFLTKRLRGIDAQNAAGRHVAREFRSLAIDTIEQRHGREPGDDRRQRRRIERGDGDQYAAQDTGAVCRDILHLSARVLVVAVERLI
jgi:hypothetical protein